MWSVTRKVMPPFSSLWEDSPGNIGGHPKTVCHAFNEAVCGVDCKYYGFLEGETM